MNICENYNKIKSDGKLVSLPILFFMLKLLDIRSQPIFLLNISALVLLSLLWVFLN